MRWIYFILLQCLLIVIVAGTVCIHKDSVILVKKPPESLSQWYKPENKRQVWLHNMFKLRREMQAVRFYSDSKDAKHLGKWAGSLSDHYLKIAEMVPEWKELLDMEVISRLEKNAKAGRYQDVSHALDDLRESCESCHSDYRAITAAMYRAPDFTSLKINPSTSFKAHMKKLTQEVNQIKIASEDGMKDIALSSLSDLKKDINLLGETCVNCHKKGAKVYPSDTISKTISSLEQSLKTGTAKEQGRDLGTLAVLACARCHGTHRLAYDARKIFSDKPRWLELIKHQ
ncbi:MAG: cytochrome c [Proteobacteria bacterium]|nr:cytochrome c [Pseudomonadota bacterium]